MPWLETESMNEKMKFISAYLEAKNQCTFKELCNNFNISCKTGYKYINRFKSEGIDGLKERSRAPHCNAKKMQATIEQDILELKYKYPHWGSKKISNWLAQEHSEIQWPAKSTIDELFKKHNLVKASRRKRRVAPYTEPFISIVQPNDSWSIDYKGQFRLGNKQLCYPLTITDNFSRYLLAVEGSERISGVSVKEVLTRLFLEFGLPLSVRSDNGPPFSSVGLGGLSTVAVWLIRLGIIPERIRPGHPEENGRHERMHLTLKKETASPAKWDQNEQQLTFDSFKKMFNEERPHEGIQFKRPAWLYAQSTRTFPSKVPQIEYDSSIETTRKIRTNGTMKWRGHEVFLSETLIGQTVGMKPHAEDEWKVFFSFLPIGIFNEKLLKITKL
jgi:transposase InsO family protein